LAIRDDGLGLPKDGPNVQGLGLKIMQYRAQKVGGTLTLQSPESGGTIVSCVFPSPSSPEASFPPSHDKHAGALKAA